VWGCGWWLDELSGGWNGGCWWLKEGIKEAAGAGCVGAENGERKKL